MEKILKALNDLGYDVLFIVETNQVIICNRFISNIIEGMGDVGFSYVEGIELTSEIAKFGITESIQAIKTRIEGIVQNFPVLKFKFSSNHKWRMYVS